MTDKVDQNGGAVIAAEAKKYKTVTECLADNPYKTTECADVVASGKTTKGPETTITIEFPKAIVDEVKNNLGIDLTGYKADYQLAIENQGSCSSYIFHDGPVTPFKDPSPPVIHYFRAYKKVEKDSGEAGVQKICMTSYDFWGNEGFVKKENCEIIKTGADQGVIHFFNVDDREERIAVKDSNAYSSAIRTLREIDICPPENAK